MGQCPQLGLPVLPHAAPCAGRRGFSRPFTPIDSKVMEPPGPAAPADACAANALCKHSFAFLLLFLFFGFYLTDLLKKQRGNTNDMFNTDQLAALQHPKEHKYHIIKSPRRRLRTKARRTALRKGDACHAPHRAVLGDTCPPALIGQWPPACPTCGPGDRSAGGWSCLRLVDARWADSCCRQPASLCVLAGCDVEAAVASQPHGTHF